MWTAMKPSEKKVLSEVKNCFMFDEESPRAGNDTSDMSTVTDGFKVTEFRADKPYRLSLYVHPSAKRKVNTSDSRILANLTQMRQNKDKENKPKRVRNTKTTKENVNVTLFDEENDTNKCEKKSRKLSVITSADGEKSSKISKKSILAYVNINESAPKKPANEEIESTLPKAKPQRIQREYTKRTKENPHSGNSVDSTLKENDVDQTNSGRVTKTNPSCISEEKNTKKCTKSKDKEEKIEEEEFEKWAESINSDFDEIDKFELSITYD